MKTEHYIRGLTMFIIDMMILIGISWFVGLLAGAAWLFLETFRRFLQEKQIQEFNALIFRELRDKHMVDEWLADMRAGR